jgi:hypothetical protein
VDLVVVEMLVTLMVMVEMLITGLAAAVAAAVVATKLDLLVTVVREWSLFAMWLTDK